MAPELGVLAPVWGCGLSSWPLALTRQQTQLCLNDGSCFSVLISSVINSIILILLNDLLGGRLYFGHLRCKHEQQRLKCKTEASSLWKLQNASLTWSACPITTTPIRKILFKKIYSLSHALFALISVFEDDCCVYKSHFYMNPSKHCFLATFF